MKYSIITLLRNIKFLMSVHLKEYTRDKMYEMITLIEDYCKYEFLDEDNPYEKDTLEILDYEKTLDLLLMQPRSFCRFGDGEIDLINGKSIAFQNYDAKLADIMLTILKENNSDLYIGINYNYFHSTRGLSAYNRKFYMLNAKPYRDFLLKNCNRERIYIAAAFNQYYMFSEHLEYREYYFKIKFLFKNRKLIIFAGKDVFSDIKYDVFEMAESKEYIAEPNRNAFEKYEDILNNARGYTKDHVLCFILGPTSKALVYQLAKEGYLAWDIGHMAKDYDAFMRGIEKTAENTRSFYAPD